MNFSDCFHAMEQMMLQPKDFKEKLAGAYCLAQVAGVTHAVYSFAGQPIVQIAGLSVNWSRSVAAAAIGSSLVYGTARLAYTDNLPQPISAIGGVILYLGHTYLGCAVVDPANVSSCAVETIATYAPVFAAGAATAMALVTYGHFANKKSERVVENPQLMKIANKKN